jgi:hypothetical protein
MNMGCHAKSSSQYKGVIYDKTRQKWAAYIGVKYRSINIGRFENEEDAAIAYNVAAQFFFGEYANLNPL